MRRLGAPYMWRPAVGDIAKLDIQDFPDDYAPGPEEWQRRLLVEVYNTAVDILQWTRPVYVVGMVCGHDSEDVIHPAARPRNRKAIAVEWFSERGGRRNLNRGPEIRAVQCRQVMSIAVHYLNHDERRFAPDVIAGKRFAEQYACAVEWRWTLREMLNMYKKPRR